MSQFVPEAPQDRERRLAAEKEEQNTTEIKTTSPIDITQFLNVYEFDCILPGSGQQVKFKPVTTGQMKKMLAYEQSDDPLDIEQALDGLITDCVVSPDFDINKLYLQDRFYLLLQIRKHSKGDRYEFQWNCPACDLDQPAVALIGEMNVVEVQDTNTIVELNESLSAEFVDV
jgi:hypothetical protein